MPEIFYYFDHLSQENLLIDAGSHFCFFKTGENHYTCRGSSLPFSHESFINGDYENHIPYYYPLSQENLNYAKTNHKDELFNRIDEGYCLKHSTFSKETIERIFNLNSLTQLRKKKFGLPLDVHPERGGLTNRLYSYFSPFSTTLSALLTVSFCVMTLNLIPGIILGLFAKTMASLLIPALLHIPSLSDFIIIGWSYEIINYFYLFRTNGNFLESRRYEHPQDWIKKIPIRSFFILISIFISLDSLLPVIPLFFCFMLTLFILKAIQEGCETYYEHHHLEDENDYDDYSIDETPALLH